MNWIPYAAGVGALAVLVVVIWATGGFRHPLSLIRGPDRRLSTSQFQFWVWTLVVVFAYVSIWTARAMKGDAAAITDIPANVMLVMGFSITTLAGAKAITVAYIDAQRIVKTTADPDKNQFGGISQLVTSDAGAPDLQKIQMLTWTAIAVVIYVLLVGATVGHIQQLKDLAALSDEIRTKGYVDGLPNIDGALMVLMGLSQGAYLGGKLTSTSQPRITTVSAATLALGEPFTVYGISLGTADDAGQITLDGVAVPLTSVTWTPTRIDARMPDAWDQGVAGPDVDLRVLVGGQTSDAWRIRIDTQTAKGSAVSVA